MTVQLLIGNDHHLVVEALAGSLRAVADFSVVGVAYDSASVVPLVLRTNPRVAVLGAAGSGALGLQIARQVLQSRPSCRVALMAPSPTRALVDQALRSGVLGVVPMDATLSHLVHTIRGVAVGCVSMQAPSGDTTSETPRKCLLTGRERDVLRLTWAGATVKDIARELCLAPGTVRNNSSVAQRKMDARNRFDAARVAQERGWL